MSLTRRMYSSLSSLFCWTTISEIRFCSKKIMRFYIWVTSSWCRICSRISTAFDLHSLLRRRSASLSKFGVTDTRCDMGRSGGFLACNRVGELSISILCCVVRYYASSSRRFFLVGEYRRTSFIEAGNLKALSLNHSVPGPTPSYPLGTI